MGEEAVRPGHPARDAQPAQGAGVAVVFASPGPGVGGEPGPVGVVGGQVQEQLGHPVAVVVADHPDVTLLLVLTVFHAVGVDPVDRGADRGVMRADGPVPRLGQHQFFDPAGLCGGEGGGG